MAKKPRAPSNLVASFPGQKGTGAPLPNAPLNLAVTGMTASTVSLSWSSTFGALSYNLYRNGVKVQTGILVTSFTDTGLTASTSYTYAVSAQGALGEGTISTSVQATTSGASNAVKFHSGHYFWFNATQWGTLASPGAEQTDFVNFVSANAANTNIQGVEVYLRQKDIEGATQGNYSVATSNINFILNTIKAQPRKLRVMIAIMDRDYGSPAVSLATWPQYMITNGWAIAGPSGNGTASILNYNNNSAIAAFSNAIKNICTLYNSEPLLEMVMMGTETSDPFSGATAWTAATYLAGLKNVYSSVVPTSPNTLLRVPANFLSFQSTQDADIVALINYLRSLKPGGFSLGGPDPEISVNYIIHAAALWRGANVSGTQGIDNRVAMPFVVEIQGPYSYPTTSQQMFNYCVGSPVGSLTGTYSNGTNTGPTQAGMTPSNWLPNHGWYIMWRSDDTQMNGITFANANGPTTLPGVPSEGTWNTN